MIYEFYVIKPLCFFKWASDFLIVLMETMSQGSVTFWDWKTQHFKSAENIQKF